MKKGFIKTNKGFIKTQLLALCTKVGVTCSATVIIHQIIVSSP